jgi:hypothetical protein
VSLTLLPSAQLTTLLRPGGGPSSLILSYLLHGHLPYYSRPHHDPILHTKLSKEPNLLKITPDAYAHFYSSLRYSTQALPVNTLLDTLIRPNADTEINPESCVTWSYKPEHAVSHVVLTSSPRPGGQWVENPVFASWDIGTLSYSEMLSLPGYTYSEHYTVRNHRALPDLQRPSRTEVADYFAAYPDAVDISDAFHASAVVSDVARTATGFLIGSHNITCKHVVLATGIFSVSIAPPPILAPVLFLHDPNEPLLVVGSGFSAADIIISMPPNRKVLHLFQWSPEKKPSPLRGCHHQAYPEYAGIYRQMKLAAIASTKSAFSTSPMMRKKSNPFFPIRDWTSCYEGFPNAEVVGVAVEAGTAKLCIRVESGEIVERTIGALAYAVGRRGRLKYLQDSLRHEVLPHSPNSTTAEELVSSRTLRSKAEVSLEMAPNVFVIGSLTGDSLVRHAFGGCVYSASRIMGVSNSNRVEASTDGFNATATIGNVQSSVMAHHDLHVDRRGMAHSHVTQTEAFA